jgi:hypothetical protein
VACKGGSSVVPKSKKTAEVSWAAAAARARPPPATTRRPRPFVDGFVSDSADRKKQALNKKKKKKKKKKKNKN